ncbi:hypothetical protein IW138_006583, partial [Coemansia sp. RSA 986]
MISGNTGGDGSSSGTGQEKAAAQPGAPGISDMFELFKDFLKTQAERDKLWREEQAERDEKQAKRDKLWREEQAERDEKQAERDRLWRMEQAERDRLWRMEQAERDKRLLEFQNQQANSLAKLEKAIDKLNQQAIQRAPAAMGANTAALRSAKLIGTPARGQQSIASQARSEAANHTGTPQVNVPKPDKFGTEWYVALSKSHDKVCKLTDLPESLRMVSESWREAWVKASDKTTLDNSPVVKKILITYRKLCKDAGATPAHS